MPARVTRADGVVRGVGRWYPFPRKSSARNFHSAIGFFLARCFYLRRDLTGSKIRRSCRIYWFAAIRPECGTSTNLSAEECYSRRVCTQVNERRGRKTRKEKKSIVAPYASLLAKFCGETFMCPRITAFQG